MLTSLLSLPLLVALASPSFGAAPPPKTKGPLETAGYKMILVDPNKKPKLPTFAMGSAPTEAGRFDDETQHQVTLTRSFHMGATEVTQALYKEIMGAEPSCKEFQGVALLDPKMPVQCVTFLDAVAFCNKLSEKEGLKAAYKFEAASRGVKVVLDPDADGYRLPTEAEWEYAARAGTAFPYPGAKDETLLCKTANGPDASLKGKFPAWTALACDDKNVGPAKVGAYAANAWGFYDLAGNVSEWVWDLQAPFTADAAVDPKGAEIATLRGVRGGSWRYDPRHLRAAARSGSAPTEIAMDLGFRIARSGPLPPPPATPVTPAQPAAPAPPATPAEPAQPAAPK